ncbi:UNVERIFIED_CONTAM: hypothetical protein FKN15_031615 [Acipenser sinensis]
MEQKEIQQEQQCSLKVAATKEFGHRQDVGPDEDLLWLSRGRRLVPRLPAGSQDTSGGTAPSKRRRNSCQLEFRGNGGVVVPRGGPRSQCQLQSHRGSRHCRNIRTPASYAAGGQLG